MTHREFRTDDDSQRYDEIAPVMARNDNGEPYDMDDVYAAHAATLAAKWTEHSTVRTAPGVPTELEQVCEARGALSNGGNDGTVKRPIASRVDREDLAGIGDAWAPREITIRRVPR